MLKLNYFLFEQLKRWRERGKISDKIRSDKMSLCLLAYYCSPSPDSTCSNFSSLSLLLFLKCFLAKNINGSTIRSPLRIYLA